MTCKTVVMVQVKLKWKVTENLVSDNTPTSSATHPKKAAAYGRAGATTFDGCHLDSKTPNPFPNMINLTPAQEDQKAIEVLDIVGQVESPREVIPWSTHA